MTSSSYCLHFAKLKLTTNRTGIGVTKAVPLPVFDLTDTFDKAYWKFNSTTISNLKDCLAFDGNRLTYIFQKIMTIDFEVQNKKKL